MGVAADRPIPRDKLAGLIALIAITVLVLSVVTVGAPRHGTHLSPAQRHHSSQVNDDR